MRPAAAMSTADGLISPSVICVPLASASAPAPAPMVSSMRVASPAMAGSSGRKVELLRSRHQVSAMSGWRSR